MLIPLALVYGMIVWARNLLFDWGILPSERFSIPVISVGNLSTGGAGKTPHVEFLVRLLSGRYRIAVLSRGYKRKTKGFLLAGPDSTVTTIGDESLQVFRKFPGIVVAVDERRRRGIRRILKEYPGTNLIILDDAFQHRYVKPGLNLLLTGYYNPFFRNYLFPAGNLRERKRSAQRADALIVTKTPPVFSPLDRRYFLKKLCHYRLPKIFFSTMEYGELQPLTAGSPRQPSFSPKTIFLLTGIANPESLEEHLKTRCKDLIVHKYPDHHFFTSKDLKKLRAHYDRTISHSKIIITTEKDAMRLDDRLVEHLDRLPCYVLPVRVRFRDQDREQFARLLEDFLSGY